MGLRDGVALESSSEGEGTGRVGLVHGELRTRQKGGGRRRSGIGEKVKGEEWAGGTGGERSRVRSEGR